MEINCPMCNVKIPERLLKKETGRYREYECKTKDCGYYRVEKLPEEKKIVDKTKVIGVKNSKGKKK